MPYGLFRTSYSHNPPPSFAYREANASLLCSYGGGSLSHKNTPVQARRVFRLLTLASLHYIIIHEDEMADTAAHDE